MRVKRVRSPNSARRTATVVGPNSGTRAHTGGLGILVQQLVDLALQLRQVLLGMFQLIAENAQAARSSSDGHPTADRRFGQPHQFLRSWPPVMARCQFMQERGSGSPPRSARWPVRL